MAERRLITAAEIEEHVATVTESGDAVTWPNARLSVIGPGHVLGFIANGWREIWRPIGFIEYRRGPLVIIQETESEAVTLCRK